MRKHLLRRGILILSMLMPLVSCSAFFGSDEGTLIQNVTTQYDDASGNTIVTITFTDEDKSPITFLIPRGESGNSIKDIKATQSSDGKSVKLTISYSDSSKEDTVIEVPVVEGRGIKECVLGEDDGNPTIKFTYTDGTESALITIPKGNDGLGIESFNVSDPDSTGVSTITVTFTDGTNKTFYVKNGVGIANVVVDETNTDSTKYVLKIIYSDGYEETVSFDRPESTKWFNGKTSPSSASLTGVNEGDYYLNRDNGNVYIYENGEWIFLFSMKGSGSESTTTYYVEFDPGQGTWVEGVSPSYIGKNSIVSKEVESGKTLSLKSIPTPQLEGYTFEGWYTDIDNPNSGKFTDMVPVFENIVVEAKYVAIE